MKKLTLAALALVAVSFTSCMKGSDSYYEGYVILLTSMESQSLDNAYTWNFGYSEIDSLKVKTKLEFKSAPVLREQTITGDTISKITYGYSKTALSLKVASNTGTTLDSLKFDDKFMASQLYVDQQPTPYFIEYDQDGFRTKVKDVQMKLEGGVYKNAIQNDTDIVTYEYTNLRNAIGLQQFSILGSDYYWPSDRFGRQSLYLLSTVKRVEGEETATYKFKYELNENGLVTTETITRDDKPFMTNKYTYKMGVVRY